MRYRVWNEADLEPGDIMVAGPDAHPSSPRLCRIVAYDADGWWHIEERDDRGGWVSGGTSPLRGCERVPEGVTVERWVEDGIERTRIVLRWLETCRYLGVSDFAGLAHRAAEDEPCRCVDGEAVCMHCVAVAYLASVGTSR